MILFENSILRMDYNPSTDIVAVKYPDIYEYLLPEIKYSIDILVETVRNYDIRRLLLDSTKTVVSVTPAESREIAAYLASRVMTTRMQKVARVQSPKIGVERRAYCRTEHQAFTGHTGAFL